MMLPMTKILLLLLCLVLAAEPAYAGSSVEQEGLLSPCAPQQAQPGSGTPPAQPANVWGVEIATSFSKQDALDRFTRIQQNHAGILSAYQPIVVEACDLHMGTKLQYSARIGMDSREDADALCGKLQADGGACIVQKN